MDQIEKSIREVLQRRAKLSRDAGTIGVQDNLYDRGLTSLMTVDIMLALEERFDLEFPEEALDRSTFHSIATMQDLLTRLGAEA